MKTAAAGHRFVTKEILAALVGVACVAAVHVVTAQNAAILPRVRSSSARIVEAIAGGVERSAIFRGLVDTIDRTDGLVSVEEGDCGHSGVRACLLLSVTVAGSNRLLRILVDLRRRRVASWWRRSATNCGMPWRYCTNAASGAIGRSSTSLTCWGARSRIGLRQTKPWKPAWQFLAKRVAAIDSMMCASAAHNQLQR
jgi:hypothetical protein